MILQYYLASFFGVAAFLVSLTQAIFCDEIEEAVAEDDLFRYKIRCHEHSPFMPSLSKKTRQMLAATFRARLCR